MRVGLIINPIAGMGGKVALKGTDGVVEEAIRRGAEPIALDLVKLFLSELSHYDESKDIEFFTGPKELGEYALRGFNFSYQVLKHREIDYKEIFGVRIPDTTSEDTKTLAKLMADKVDILVFAGGDGTARDVYSAVNRKVPILGIPTGVKMFSGVFASSPEDAAKLLIEFLKGNAQIVEREILDLDEDSYRKDEVRVRLYGTALTPYLETLVQGSKEPTTVDESEELEALAEAIVEELEDGIYFLGAGSTVKTIKDKLGIDGTLLGVDIVEIKDGRVRLLVKDAQEKDLLKFINRNPKIIVTVVGGVNFLFGRGNQQFSSDVLRHIPKENIIVVAAPSKVEKPIRVYTGDKEVDKMLKGYIRVKIGPWRDRIVKVI
ncbi:ATP-NAD kinase family protein [Thermococcus sp. SY098]|uniref:ATP-NAD kinase family protein n=1 Tax=Thermococcus sp. SY098 TaxID=3111325 RepID=UPI002D77835D|nr:ATP-NAD kinase family protein [Thermococcus sp. SY098]WRS52266.1 ATP-NAD kinase family protein [Thermococcus sp. SY098]